MIIHYELLGSHPEVQTSAQTLSSLISLCQSTNSASSKRVLENIIVKSAAHFYGLSFEDYGDVKDLICAIKGMDEQLAVA